MSIGSLDDASAQPPKAPPVKPQPPKTAPAKAQQAKPQPKPGQRPIAKAPLPHPPHAGEGAKKPAPKGRGRHDLPLPRLPGSAAGKPDEQARQTVTGRYPEHSTAAPHESSELRSMRDLDAMLFPPVKAPSSAPWALSLKLPEEGPKVDASGLPSPAPAEAAPSEAEGKDLGWLTALEKPDIPVRFEPSVVRYLTYYKDNPRGRKLVQTWVKRAGRYREAIVKLLHQYNLPEDLLWLALVESAFDPTIHSGAGAAGLWQFVPATGRIYGLTINRRVDERLDPERSTHAAIKHLQDLHARFGTWELAFAAYNMGYGGLLASIRKYNTNDYWELRRLEAAIPYETALYVPKIVSIAIAARNCKVFGCEGIDVDPVEPFGDTAVDKVAVAPGVSVEDVATAAGVKPEAIAALNPQLIGTRLPPLEQSSLPRDAWTVYVPRGKGAVAAQTLPHDAPPHQLATYRVRWGEPAEHVAARFATSTQILERLNDLEPHESPRAGMTIFVPAGATPKSDGEAAAAVAGGNGTGPHGKPLLVVPDHSFAYGDRRRVFYQAVFGDTLEDVAESCGVTGAEVRRWNHLDPSAALQDGMTLQLYIPNDAAPKDVLLLEEAQVEPVSVESSNFFSYFVGQIGRERIEITAKKGDSWRSIAGRYGLSVSMIERINQKSRHSRLEPGDKVVVYARRGNGPLPADAPAGGAPNDGVDAVDETVAADETAKADENKPDENTESSPDKLVAPQLVAPQAVQPASAAAERAQKLP